MIPSSSKVIGRSCVCRTRSTHLLWCRNKRKKTGWPTVDLANRGKRKSRWLIRARVTSDWSQRALEHTRRTVSCVNGWQQLFKFVEHFALKQAIDSPFLFVFHVKQQLLFVLLDFKRRRKREREKKRAFVSRHWHTCCCLVFSWPFNSVNRLDTPHLASLLSIQAFYTIVFIYSQHSQQAKLKGKRNWKPRMGLTDMHLLICSNRVASFDNFALLFVFHSCRPSSAKLHFFFKGTVILTFPLKKERVSFVVFFPSSPNERIKWTHRNRFLRKS